jgi:hypothetical protein
MAAKKQTPTKKKGAKKAAPKALGTVALVVRVPPAVLAYLDEHGAGGRGRCSCGRGPRRATRSSGRCWAEGGPAARHEWRATAGPHSRGVGSIRFHEPFRRAG